jgi:hypothetical protein
LNSKIHRIPKFRCISSTKFDKFVDLLSHGTPYSDQYISSPVGKLHFPCQKKAASCRPSSKALVYSVWSWDLVLVSDIPLGIELVCLSWNPVFGSIYQYENFKLNPKNSKHNRGAPSHGPWICHLVVTPTRVHRFILRQTSNAIT